MPCPNVKVHWQSGDMILSSLPSPDSKITKVPLTIQFAPPGGCSVDFWVRWFLEKFVESLLFSVTRVLRPSPLYGQSRSACLWQQCDRPSAARQRFHFRVIVFFNCVSLHRRNQYFEMSQSEPLHHFSWELPPQLRSLITNWCNLGTQCLSHMLRMTLSD